jgi:hypothetical protein
MPAVMRKVVIAVLVMIFPLVESIAFEEFGRDFIDFGRLEGNQDLFVVEEIFLDELGRIYTLDPENWRLFRERRFGRSSFEDKLPLAGEDTGFSLRTLQLDTEAPRFSGERVLEIAGELDTEYSTLLVIPPFPIPDSDAFVHNGMLPDIGPIYQIALEVRNHGDPVDLTLVLEDDLENTVYIRFSVPSTPDIFFTLTYVNPFFELEYRFPDFHIEYLRLKYLSVESHTIDQYWKGQAIPYGSTDEERAAHRRDNPPRTVISPVHLELKSAYIME